MSCVPGPSTSKEDLEKWTLNVNVMLNSPRGRRKFQEFLSEWNLEDDEMTLQFWEKCNSILLEASHNKDLKKDEKSAKIHHMRFFKEVMNLVEFAEEYVNFDAGQLRKFRQTVEKKNVSLILKEISQVQSAASYLLSSKFELFRTNLIKVMPAPNAKKK